MADVLAVMSKVKDYVKSNSEGFRVSGDVAAKLTEIIKERLDAAIERAGDAKRVTIKAEDL